MRVTINQLQEMKNCGEKISMITAYDYTSGKLLEEVGIPIILVGDSLGQVILGYDSTIPVTMADMIHHTKAVVRGTEKSHIVADLPFLTYQASIDDALYNAGRLLKEGGAQSVKVEGGQKIAKTVSQMVDIGIPVMGHIGLTPQSVNQLGGYKVQGKTSDSAAELIEDAKALENAGVYALVLESIPIPLGKLITEQITIPTIGIGAGVHCDGQVQVFHDLLGLFTDFTPRHARQYSKLNEIIKTAVSSYIDEVKTGDFPSKRESFDVKDNILKELT